MIFIPFFTLLYANYTSINFKCLPSQEQATWSMEEKLEELSTSDMKTFILELRPEIMQKLYNLSDDDVKAMYQAIVK